MHIDRIALGGLGLVLTCCGDGAAAGPAGPDAAVRDAGSTAPADAASDAELDAVSDPATAARQAFVEMKDRIGHVPLRNTDCGRAILLAFLRDPEAAPDTRCIDATSLELAADPTEVERRFGRPQLWDDPSTDG